jgi:hypothetical protein
MYVSLRPAIAGIIALAVLCVTSPPVAAGPAEALSYVKTRQAEDGGFAEPDSQSDWLTTCWAMLAGAGAGENVLEWKKGDRGPLEYLASQAGSLSRLEDIEMFALAVSEAGADPHDLGGEDLVALINAHVEDDGRIGDTIAQHCWGMIALSAAGESNPPGSTGWLVENQRADGGWGESDEVVTADTGLAVEALVAVGERDNAAVETAMTFLRGRMGPEGGFAGPSGRPETPLTSSVVRAIYAASQDPSSDKWSSHGSDPIAFIGSMQSGDGRVQYAEGVESQPALTTAVAAVALQGRHFPFGVVDGTDTRSGGQRDLGTMGANMVPGEAAVPGTTVESLSPSARTDLEAQGGASSRGTFSGLWLFLMICGAYLVALVASAIIASALYEPSPARPGQGEAPVVSARDSTARHDDGGTGGPVSRP